MRAMTRTVLLGIGCSLALAGTAAAGQSAAQFRRAADALCQESSSLTTQYERENGIAFTQEEQLARLEDRLPGQIERLEELEALKPPKKLRAAFQEFVDFRGEILDNNQKVLDANESGDAATMEELRLRNFELDDLENAAAADAGLVACAEIVPKRVETEVRQIVEDFWTSSDPARCTEAYTEAYITSFPGSVEQCEADESNPAFIADSVDIFNVEGVVKSRIEVEFDAVGGPDVTGRFRELLVYEDGQYKRQAIYSLPPA